MEVLFDGPDIYAQDNHGDPFAYKKFIARINDSKGGYFYHEIWHVGIDTGGREIRIAEVSNEETADYLVRCINHYEAHRHKKDKARHTPFHQYEISD